MSVEIIGRNRLGEEKSPYLLQHQHNPVWWYAWGDEAFEAARAENKPIFLSIGYSTCYWCHVMERDSFEDEDVAFALNQDFICIKVDREERPDLDAIYMDAVVGMHGHGGWPMSVFLSADREPFYGGTFFYKAQFLQMLERISGLWKNEREKIAEASSRLVEFLRERRVLPETAGGSGAEVDFFHSALRESESSFDAEYGGFGAAPKFPPSGQIALLLRIARRLQSDSARKMAVTTLEAMARGGIYDQVGGGFSRYSTDAKWLVPHFEKMLYDNALLAHNYFEAFQLTGREVFRDIGVETLDYVLREMTSPEGGFYSAQDAGDVGEEGDFYVWAHRDLKQLLSPEEFERFEKAYGVTAEGNFEAKFTVLALQREIALEERADSLLKSARAKLFAIRRERKAPRLDDKILSAWNGLMISAFALGSRASGERRFLDAARRGAEFLQKHLYRDGVLLRRFRDGDARIHAFAEDYAFVIQALLDLHQAGLDLRWLEWARELQDAQNRLFWDEKDGGYFSSSAADVLVARKEYPDNAIPSPNSVAMFNLLRLDVFFDSREYREKAERIEQAASPFASRYPLGFSRMLCALDFKLGPQQQLVIAESGTEAGEKLCALLGQKFMPHLTLARLNDAGGGVKIALLSDKSVQPGRAAFYLCENRTCELPTNDFEEVTET